MGESTFKTRLQTEEAELLVKMENLNAFRLTDKFKELEIVQQELLHIQFAAMMTYINCLTARIATIKE